MPRKLFCEISPLTYRLSLQKEIAKRNLRDLLSNDRFAATVQEELFPIVAYRHKSLIRRKLGDVDLQLQENKATNLKLAARHLNHLIIQPNEVFSFWKRVGECTAEKGYLTGLTIQKNQPGQGIGGGLCQMTNLLHWMVLHTPLQIIEHHHHGRFDLFPDFNRQIPFGTGTSIVYNRLDYRFRNTTEQPFQLVIYTDDRYLCGEIRTTKPLPISYHIYEKDGWFTEEDDGFYRHNIVRRQQFNKQTGQLIEEQCLIENHAKVMYDTSTIDPAKIRNRKKV